MTIKFLDRKEIDTEKWDACVASYPESASLFAETRYLDLCCEQWSALVQDDYQAVMPLPWKKKAYIYYVYPPFFLPRLGLYGRELSAGELPEWINAIPSYFKWKIYVPWAVNCLLSDNICNPDLKTLMSWNTFTPTSLHFIKKKVWHWDLRPWKVLLMYVLPIWPNKRILTVN
jgi:hypothetical protein